MTVAAGRSGSSRRDPKAVAARQHRKALECLQAGTIEPIPVSAGYRLGLLLVAGTMLVLPLIYLGLIALTGYGLFWYATSSTGLFTAAMKGSRGGRAIFVVILLYMTPLLVGGILLLFMIKPLFARRVRDSFPLSLSRAEEPALYEFISQLCRVVGAPNPIRIDVDTSVNASASFAEGLGGFLRKDLVLTIGLPLAAAMDLRQLTGVLAHELGHFAQGTAMRLSYIVRSINAWFARLVYERDEWDDWIRAGPGTDQSAIILILVLARIFVWMTRRILWVLMMLGHGASCLMLRQMEFDADRYEARIAGSKTFLQTCEMLGLLHVASNAAMNELEMAWRERKLGDDLPSLIRSREREMPKEIRAAVLKAACGGETGWFDTHPAPSQRIASARHEPADGVFTVDAPASVIFKDFPDICRRATVAFYHEALGGAVKRENLISTESMDVDRGKKRESFESLRRYFQDLLHPMRPVYPDRSVELPSQDHAEIAMRLMELRTHILDALPAATAAAKLWGDAEDRIIAATRAKFLRAAGQPVNAKELGFNKADDLEIRAVATGSQKRQSEAARVLTDALSAGAERMSLALTLERLQSAPKKRAVDEQVPEEEDFGEYDLADASDQGFNDPLMEALGALRSVSDCVERLRRQQSAFESLLSRCKSEGNPQTLVEEVLALSRKIVSEIAQIHGCIRSTTYPYERSEKRMSLANYIIPNVPDYGAVGEVYDAADATLEGIFSLYMRLMSDLAKRAEAVEASLGLDPFPTPPDEAE